MNLWLTVLTSTHLYAGTPFAATELPAESCRAGLSAPNERLPPGTSFACLTDEVLVQALERMQCRITDRAGGFRITYVCKGPK
jgi:hypothetical protein